MKRTAKPDGFAKGGYGLRRKKKHQEKENLPGENAIAGISAKEAIKQLKKSRKG